MFASAGPVVVAAAAAAASPEAKAPAPVPWKGATMKPLVFSVLVASIVWLLPSPVGVAVKAWHLLAIFLGTVVGIITTPLPLGAVAILGLGACMATGTLTFAQAFSAMSNEIPWCVASPLWRRLSVPQRARG